MTFIGKLFVMVNLILSLLMSAVAFGMYAGAVDWTDNKGKQGQPPGKLVAVKDEITDRLRELYTAENSYRLARSSVFTREVFRQFFRQAYDKELLELITDKGPVRITQTVRGFPKLDNQNLPVMAPADHNGQPLMAYYFYINDLERLRKQSSDLQAQVKMKVEEDARLTNEIIGESDKMIRGLNDKIDQERIKRMGIVDELGIVRGLKVNVEVESELVYSRLKALNERIKELTSYLKTKHKVDVSEK